MSLLLDITRFVSRAHLSFDTGIDRVERAFILDTLERFENPRFIARLGRRFVVLDRQAMQVFLQHESTQNWPRVSGEDLFRLKLSKSQRRVRSALRKLGHTVSAVHSLPVAINGLNIGVFNYTNVGHSNLSKEFLTAIREAGARKISAFVHDVIPLDYPQYCRTDRIKPFAENMRNVMKYCDQVFCNSQYTADRISFHFDQTPSLRVVHLASNSEFSAHDIPSKNFKRPTFVMLGTIEPRKNLSFALDIWEVLSTTIPASRMPNLAVIGKRGWEDSETLKRLDRAAYVSELNDLADQEVLAHLSACTALLFPSHVEGFGLPIQEALSLGVPVIASDIPVFRELFADTATLLPIENPQVWVDFIQNVLLNPDRYSPSADYLNKTKTWNDFFVDIYTNLNDEHLS